MANAIINAIAKNDIHETARMSKPVFLEYMILLPRDDNHHMIDKMPRCFHLGGFALHPCGISQKRIIAEIINGANFRLLFADPDETITVDITLLRFTHGRSAPNELGMGTFGPVFGLEINPRVMGAVMAVLLRHKHGEVLTR